MTEPWTAEPLNRDVLGAADLANSNGRVIRYLLSNSSVARDGHTIATSGWSLDRYRQNPVMLWAHDGNMPPIGKMVEIGTVGDRLMGSFKYPEEDEYKFADTIYRLVRGGYLNAVSVGWIPIEWEYAKDRARPGGIDFKRAELIEVSQVPVGALPDALVAARAAGIDTGPLYEWAEKVLDQGGDKILVPRAQLEALRRAAKMPTPSAHDDADLPRRKRDFRERLVRDLSECAWLGMIVDQLACLEECLAYDAEYEGEESPIAGRLQAVLRTLGQILIDMTVEEVGEMLGPDLEEDTDTTPAQRALRMIGRAFIAAKTPPAPAGPAIVQIGTDAARIVADALQRAGRVLSAENETTLRQALDMHTSACDMIRSVCERGAPPVEPPMMDDAERSLAKAKETVARLRQAAA